MKQKIGNELKSLIDNPFQILREWAILMVKNKIVHKRKNWCCEVSISEFVTLPIDLSNSC